MAKQSIQIAGVLSLGLLLACQGEQVPDDPTRPIAPDGGASIDGDVVTGPAFYQCSQVIGFSQTVQWYQNPPEFEATVDNERWQFLGRGGAATDLWANPEFDAWDLEVFSPCATRSTDPDRVVLTISSNLDLQDDASMWADMIVEVVATISQKYPGLEMVTLQPVVGGPADGPCVIGGATIRATKNHPTIDAALAEITANPTVAGVNIEAGASPEVSDCALYSDSKGHLRPEGGAAVGKWLGEFYLDEAR